MANQQAQDLRRVYYHIIDDVVAKMKPEYLQENVDESVLQTIRQRWAQKLVEKNIIIEGDAQDEAKKEEEAAASRKRPFDGSGPTTKQEAAAAAGPASAANTLIYRRAAAQGLGPVPQGFRPAGQAQMPQPLLVQQAALAAAVQQQQQQQRPQQPQQQALQQQLQGLPPTALLQSLAGLQNLPPHQQQLIQAHLQALAQRGALRPQGIPAQPAAQAAPAAAAAAAQLPGMQPAQGLPPGAAQLQGLAGLRGQPGPHQGLAQPGLPHHQQQGLPQQHGLQQQGLPMQGLSNAMPGVVPRGMLPQGMLQQSIPQQDGSSDPPPTLAEVAQAAGLQPEQLRAILPRRIAAIMDRTNDGGSRSGTSHDISKPSRAAAAAAAGAGPSSSSGSGRVGSGGVQKQQQRRQRRRRIPQVDGMGDEDGYEDDEEDDGDAGGAADEDEDDAAEGDDDSDGDLDEIAKLDDDLDALEEAEKEETGDLGFALYEKVHRAKNRWRCNLRYGVFLINGKEYMFNKGNTDLTF